MKYTIILLLALLIVTKESGDSYQINTFLNYLQKNDYFEIINEVKCQLSDEIAIEICETLTESPYCEEIVKIYMVCNYPSYIPPSPASTPTPSHADILTSILDLHNIPVDKFKRLIIKLRYKNVVDESEIKPLKSN